MKTNTTLDFKFIKDIVWYDGPLISLGLTNDNIPVLEIWCDFQYNSYDTYAYAYIKKDDLIPFLNSEKSYFNVLKDSEEIVIFTYKLNSEEINKEPEFNNISNSDFLKKYGPTEDSDLTNDLVDFNKIWNEFINQEKNNA